MTAVGRPSATSRANDGPVTTAAGVLRQTLGDELVQEATRCRDRSPWSPRRCRRAARSRVAIASSNRGERMARHRDQHGAGIAHGRLERTGELQRIGQRELGQIARVAPRGRHVDDRLRRASPQRRRYAVAREQRGERRAPGAGAENRDRRWRSSSPRSRSVRRWRRRPGRASARRRC